jgi:hypothetical protein
VKEENHGTGNISNTMYLELPEMPSNYTLDVGYARKRANKEGLESTLKPFINSIVGDTGIEPVTSGM